MLYNDKILLFSACPARCAGTQSFSVASKRNHRKLQIAEPQQPCVQFVYFTAPCRNVNFRIKGDLHVAKNGHH
jgi:hypothetical protein